MAKRLANILALKRLYAERSGEEQPRRCPFPVSSARLVQDFFSEQNLKERMRMQHLWDNWEMTMGPMLSPIAFPLGHKNDTIFVGGPDAMAVQELQLQGPEILERVNAFFGEELFHHVRVSPLLGRRPLNRPLSSPSAAPARRPEKGVPLTGEFLEGMDAASPVARAYRRFLQRSRAM